MMYVRRIAQEYNRKICRVYVYRQTTHAGELLNAAEASGGVNVPRVFCVFHRPTGVGVMQSEWDSESFSEPLAGSDLSGTLPQCCMSVSSGSSVQLRGP